MPYPLSRADRTADRKPNPPSYLIPDSRNSGTHVQAFPISELLMSSLDTRSP
jgi:hypothetical protein